MNQWSLGGQVVGDLAELIMSSAPAKKLVEMAVPAAAGLAASAATGNPAVGKLASGAMKAWSVAHGESFRNVSGVLVASVALPVAGLLFAPIGACFMLYAMVSD